MPDDSAESKRARRARPDRAFASEPPPNTLQATRTLTSSRHAASRSHEAPVPTAVADGDRSESTPERKPASATRAVFAAMPEDILERYYRIGPKYFLDNGELAFTHHVNKLVTPSENTQIVRDLLEIVHHNGVRDITVTGTERFRREVWAAAMRHGIEVHGYAPSAHDEKQWVRAAAHERGPRSHSADAPQDLEPLAEGPAVRAPEAAARVSPAERDGAARSHATRDRLYTGELLAHGPENYLRSPHEDMSYYVQLDTGERTVELWGKDLQRAFRESKSRPQVGDRIVVRQTGQQDVTVRAREFDTAGQLLGEKDKETHRNAWKVEKADFLAERAALAQVVRDPTVDPERGTRAHPQLVGTYFLLRKAELFAAEGFHTQKERQAFVAFARERLAEIIERGGPLPKASLRDRSAERSRARPPREPSLAEAPAPLSR